jgi:hypothetical protein
VALVVAGVVALPANIWLIGRGKGHAVVHETGIHGGPHSGPSPSSLRCSASPCWWPRRSPRNGCRAFPPATAGVAAGVFVFFSNRLGCLGSLAISAVVTLVLLLALGVLD